MGEQLLKDLYNNCSDVNNSWKALNRDRKYSYKTLCPYQCDIGETN